MARPEAWDAYEEAVIAGRGADAAPPGDDYEMSERFRQWILERMRDEVMGQVTGAGLDRMAIVKAPRDGSDGSADRDSSEES